MEAPCGLERCPSVTARVASELASSVVECGARESGNRGATSGVIHVSADSPFATSDRLPRSASSSLVGFSSVQRRFGECNQSVPPPTNAAEPGLRSKVDCRRLLVRVVPPGSPFEDRRRYSRVSAKVTPAVEPPRRRIRIHSRRQRRARASARWRARTRWHSAPHAAFSTRARASARPKIVRAAIRGRSHSARRESRVRSRRSTRRADRSLRLGGVHGCAAPRSGRRESAHGRVAWPVKGPTESSERRIGFVAG